MPPPLAGEGQRDHGGHAASDNPPETAHPGGHAGSPAEDRPNEQPHREEHDEGGKEVVVTAAPLAVMVARDRDAVRSDDRQPDTLVDLGEDPRAQACDGPANAENDGVAGLLAVRADDVRLVSGQGGD